ncbi:hypothetical protein [Bradyrhizobium erythrophlei]|jgi:hypothetical protein|uniref:hypothetical protein n=1 Tax=Bradyrhizobium erythrophlei TaxID=1437360 RepID=UPI0009A83E2B|nr:hypothetical protein [Bradyrhizobium erythrophlei]
MELNEELEPTKSAVVTLPVRSKKADSVRNLTSARLSRSRDILLKMLNLIGGLQQVSAQPKA